MDLVFVVVTIVIYFSFSVVHTKKQKDVSLILHNFSVENESNFVCPVHLLFDIVFLNVKRKFINPQNFTLLSSKCLFSTLCSPKLCSDAFKSVS